MITPYFISNDIGGACIYSYPYISRNCELTWQYPLNELPKATGIHRATLSKIANGKGCYTGTDNIDALCSFIECRVEELLVHLPEPVPKVD
jgi:DNA-binding Xre family transcriptional regulator